MTLHNPFKISSRLLPALVVGGATISIERDGETRDGRDRFRWYIDLSGGEEHTGNDLKSGCQGCGLQEAFASLLAFLGACAESIAHDRRTGREGDNADLFPIMVGEWADQNSDELSMLQCELEETPNLIEE